ncbi:MAG TPA: PucR family transcriptional regulator ligand-binding domain-containing protein [Yinghuangia sp.]|uniref:PucR family transcriptional regulator n=1 Tax=Yinghuangia sp. YIM S10712 TaxID=3436930 RepID=UPI002CE36A82|nr:PucR family transcriptional regulator ligand-binding domain-containing protein [Yinghuangia sp.]
MFPSVADVVALDAVRRGMPQVVAGARGLARPVRWVHISELPDAARLLRGGELVLATGIALPEDSAGLERYVRELVDIEAAGLVIELGRRYTGELPRPLVDAAEKARFPLVTLHRETHFVGITEAVHSLVIDAQLAELRESEAVHQAFTELAVEGAEPGDVVRQASRMSGRPVVLENLAHQVLAYDAAGTRAETLLDHWEDRSRQVRPSTRTEYDERAGWLVTMVGARGHDWGRLVLVGDGASPPAKQTMLLERAASTLALNRLVVRDRETLERQTHRTLLSGILTHSYTVAEVTLRARALGVHLEGRRLVGVVLRLRRGVTPAVLEAQIRLRDFTETAAAAVRERRLVALVGGLDDDSVGLLIALGPQDAEDAALQGFSAALRKLAPDFAADVVIAVGSSVGAVRDARRSLLEATQVADAALHQGSGAAFYRLPDVRLRGLLHLLRDDTRLQTYVERELGPLLEYDAQHGTHLVQMLAVYLEHGRNKSAAADAAHLSRPSFYERLHRIERVLSVDLDQVESCLSLHVALLGLEALRR